MYRLVFSKVSLRKVEQREGTERQVGGKGESRPEKRAYTISPEGNKNGRRPRTAPHHLVSWEKPKMRGQQRGIEKAEDRELKGERIFAERG